MADTRELILARLLTIFSGISGVDRAVRNPASLDDTETTRIILLDADETIDPAFESPGRPIRSPPRVIMAPEIFLSLGRRSEDVGTELNEYRALLVKSVLEDSSLQSILGSNGLMRYEGCDTALALGRTLVGEMRIAIAFYYMLRPEDL